MFSSFKLRTSLSLGLVMGLLIVGCDSKVGEAPPDPKAHSFSGTQCLSEATPVIVQFIEGTAQEAKLVDAFDCATTAVQDFKRYVRGNSAETYTAQELSTFLEDNFLTLKDGERISPKLQAEAMKIKQLFVGGSVDHVTRAELDKTITFLADLKKIAVDVNPYMKVLTRNWSVDESKDLQEQNKTFEAANKGIQKAARELVALIERNERSYVISDFGVLMTELGKFFNKGWAFPAEINKYLPVVQKVKKAIAGGPENLIQPKEWTRLATLGSRGYIQYLRYHYFIAKSSQQGTGHRLNYIATSVDDILSIFQEVLLLKPEQTVAKGEVLELLQTLQNVWPEFRVSVTLLDELMKVKQVLIGGSTEAFTTADFEKSRTKIERAKILIEGFTPYYAIYMLTWDPSRLSVDGAQKEFLEAQDNLQKILPEAAVLLEGPYDLNNIMTLTHELETLYPKEMTGLSQNVKKFMPLVLDVKKMVFAGNDSIIRPESWQGLANLGSLAYSHYLYYNYFLTDANMNSVTDLTSWSIFVNKSLDFVRDVILYKKEGYFSKSELAQIANRLIEMEILPDMFSKDSINRIIDVAVNNFFIAPHRRIEESYQPNALNRSAIEVVRSELQVLIDTQIWIAKKTEGFGEEDGFKASTLINHIENTQSDKSISAALRVGVGELLLAVSSPVPVTIDKKGRIGISNRVSHRYTKRSLTRQNLTRGVSRLLIRSFVNSTQRIKNYTGATSSEIENGFNKVRPVVIDLGLIDSKDTTFASSRARDANLFMPHSDSSALVSYAELNDIAQMIWSGITLNNDLKAQLLKDCFGGRSSVKSSEKVTLACLRSSYRRSGPKKLVSMPGYVELSAGLNDADWSSYFQNILKSAGYVPNASNTAALGDISLVPHALQYVEMFFARFDKDQNNVISTQEGISAFPVFKGILKDLAAKELADGTIKESELLDLFTYILKERHPPLSLGEKISFAFSWKGKQDKWNISANRPHLAEILGYIADEVNKAKKK